jgi:hypothetical protein
MEGDMGSRVLGLVSAIALGVAVLAPHAASAAPAGMVAAQPHEVAAPLQVQYRGGGTIYYYYEYDPGPSYSQRRYYKGYRAPQRYAQRPAWGDNPPRYDHREGVRSHRGRDRDRHYGYDDRRDRRNPWGRW